MHISFLSSLLLLLSLTVATAQECISHTDGAGATYGTAEFIGEPWTYSWVVDQTWDNARGEWIAIDPITHTVPVLGAAIHIRFADGSEFRYGAELDYHAKGDNLHTISHSGYGGEAGPYQAMRTADGRILLLDEERCEPVSWDLSR